MEFSLPLPQPLAKEGMVQIQWKKFFYRFQCHKTASPFQDPCSKIRSTLLFAACQEFNTVCESLKQFGVDIITLDKILEAIEQTILPRFILLFERFRYFTLEQEPSENLTDFLQMIRKQGELCEFGKMKDSDIASMLDSSAMDDSLRQSFFNSAGLSFDENVNVSQYSKTALLDQNLAVKEDNPVVETSRKGLKFRVKMSSAQNSDGSSMFLMPLSEGLDEEDDDINDAGNQETVSPVMDPSDHPKNIKEEVSDEAHSSKPKIFLCFKCDNEYATRKSFRRHIAAKHADCKRYFCKHCKKVFSNRTLCISHCKGHTTQPAQLVSSYKDVVNTEYACCYCDETLPSYEDYKKHSLVHSAVRVFTCDLCQKKNHTILRMVGHIKGHLYPKHKCPICANCFGRQELLQIHMQTHLAHPLHECQVCSKGFVSADRLQGHMRTHTGEKRFTCELCGKSFSQKMSFDYHKRWHSGEKPYECEICGSRARSFGDLKKHKRLHSDKLPYVCEVCGKSFRFTSNLNRHRRGHSGKRAYACDVCGRTFIYNEGLRDHIKAGRCPGRKNGENKVTPRKRRVRTSANTLLTHPQVHIENDYNPINYTTTGHHINSQPLQHELPPVWQYMVRSEPEGSCGVIIPPYY